MLINITQYQWSQLPNKKAQTNRMNVKIKKKKKEDAFFCYIKKTHLNIKTFSHNKRMEKIILANGAKKQAHIVALISHK